MFARQVVLVGARAASSMTRRNHGWTSDVQRLSCGLGGLSSRVCGLASGVSCQLLAASASTCVTYARLPIGALGDPRRRRGLLHKRPGPEYSGGARGESSVSLTDLEGSVLREHPTGAGGPLCWLRRDRAQGRFAPGFAWNLIDEEVAADVYDRK